MEEKKEAYVAPASRKVDAFWGENGEFSQNLKEYLEMQHLYNSAIQEIQTKLEILNDEFQVKFARNPIHHIETRLKSARSIIGKLRRKNFPVSIDSAKENLHDIAGIRVVCCYIEDCYRVAEMLLRQSDLRAVEYDDYIKNPLPHGYRSLHLDLEVPIYLSDRTEKAIAEIQIRTVGMDFWASLEHDMRYKCDCTVTGELEARMAACAERIAEIDREMQNVFKEVSKLKMRDDEFPVRESVEG